MRTLRKTGIMVGLASVFLLAGPAAALADSDCEPVAERPIKIEAWMSKRYEKDLMQIGRKFVAMGHTRVTMFVYAGDNPSRMIAIGRCVPAYIAQHVLREARQYFREFEILVNQGFISTHWIALGTSLFNELQQAQRVSREQVARLADAALDTQQFQALYQELSVQAKTVRRSGMDLPNPKLLATSE